jgi:PAS domain S-box-containing protein
LVVTRVSTPRFRLSRITIAVGIAGVALAAAVGAIAQAGVKAQEDRLLAQKAVDANAFLVTLFSSAQESLRVLTGDGIPTPDELSDYLARAGPLGGATTAVFTARPSGDGLVVAASIGAAPQVGEKVSSELSPALARASRTGAMATTLLHTAGRTTLLLAFPSQDAHGAIVTAQESIVHPAKAFELAAGSPFADLRGAFYAGPPAASNLLLTTEPGALRPGAGVRTSVPIGGDVYTTIISARTALVGPIDKAVPVVLLGGGLVTAALAAAVAHVLSRRRDMAMALAMERTLELAQTHDFLEGILTGGPLVVARRGITTNTVTYVSPNVERVFGYSAKAAAARGLLSGLTHREDQAAFRAALGAVESGAALQTQVESRVRLPDGRYRWISTTLVREDGDDNAMDAPQPYIAEYILDVDDRHRAEAAQREAFRLAEEAQARAEKESQHKTEFLSHMSHELRTPLNAVLGFAQLLEAEVTDESQQEEIRQILDGGNHLLALINELLDIARIESGRLAISLEEVDPVRSINEAVETIRPLATQRNITIRRDLEGGSGWVLRADPQRTKQVLLNLLSNAVKYNKPSGTISVTARLVAAGRVAIDISDTGPGIAPDKLERLFEPFERVGAEYTGVDGAGIGLAVARRLSDAMGATLSVKSREGSGSTFTVEFNAEPAATAPLQEVTSPPAPCVLYIEDDVANLKLVERLFEKDGDLRLMGATTGSLGLQLALEHAPALILLDLNLPDIRGEEVLRRLRADPATARVPVVILSADAMPAHVDQLLREGAVAYLTKPLVLSEVLRVVHEALEGTATQSASAPRLSA